jgi:hypothetical protein
MDDATRGQLTNRFAELAGFMVTSARGLLDEPAAYGPFRLLDATRRLVAVLESEGLSNEALDGLRERITEAVDGAMDEDADGFRAFLDDLVLSLLDD